MFSKTLPITPIHYLKNIELPTKNQLRIEIEKKDTLIEYLTKTTDLSILKYLYYEYYGEECKNKNQIKKSLLKELEKDWNKKQNNLYKMVKLLKERNSTLKKTP